MIEADTEVALWADVRGANAAEEARTRKCAAAPRGLHEEPVPEVKVEALLTERESVVEEEVPNRRGCPDNRRNGSPSRLHSREPGNGEAETQPWRCAR